MSGLPIEAVDERVIQHAASLDIGTLTGDVFRHACGCEHRGDKWYLCPYHDGLNDGLAIAWNEANG